MRVARKKVKGEDCYYHCCARIAGPKNCYLFNDVDREKGMQIVVDLSRLFLVEPISMTWMGNHWHIVLFAPGKPPSPEQAAERYNAYYGKMNRTLVPKDDPEDCQRIAEQLIDISFFMRQIHQKFTTHINKAHERRGTLWADRFKSTILEDRSALWTCVKYVELNPVRAGLASDPADYRFCSWGNFTGTGKHLFGDNFTRHLRKYLGEIAVNWSDEDIYIEFRSQMAKILATEAGAAENEICEAGEIARRKESMPIRFLRRTRHWTDGAIIGSKIFVQAIAGQFDDRKRVLKKQLSTGINEAGSSLYCFKRLRNI